MKLVARLSVIALAVCLGGSATADEPGNGAPPPGAPEGGPEGLFAEMDANGDGYISRDEVPEEKRRLLKRLMQQSDKDGDQRLSKDEFAAGLKENRPDRPLAEAGGRPGRPPRFGAGQPGGPPGGPDGPGDPLGRRLMEALDTDGDHALSTGELAAASEALKKLDTDGDGALSAEELHGPPPREGEGRPSPEQLLARLMQADADGDGKLSTDECPPRLQPVFERLDGNADGFLDESEVKEGVQAIGRFMKNKGKPAKAQGKKKKKPEVN